MRKSELPEEAWLIDERQVPGGAWIATVALSIKGQRIARILHIWDQIGGVLPRGRAVEYCRQINERAQEEQKK